MTPFDHLTIALLNAGEMADFAAYRAWRNAIAEQQRAFKAELLRKMQALAKPKVA